MQSSARRVECDLNFANPQGLIYLNIYFNVRNASLKGVKHEISIEVTFSS